MRYTKRLQECHHSVYNKDSRLPVTVPVLANVMRGINTSMQNLNTKWLHKSIFLLAVIAYLRFGKIVVKQELINV